jgi:hypothetical protein
VTPCSRTTPTKTPDWELSVLGTVSLHSLRVTVADGSLVLHLANRDPHNGKSVTQAPGLKCLLASRSNSAALAKT